jgi:hypothetical protein
MAAKSPEASKGTKEKEDAEEKVANKKQTHDPVQDAKEEDGTDMWSCPKCTFKNSPLLPICEICEEPKARGHAERATRESATSKRKRLKEQNLEKARNIEIEAKRRKNAVKEDRLRRSEGQIRCNHGKAKIQKQGTIVNQKTEEGKTIYMQPSNRMMGLRYCKADSKADQAKLTVTAQL